MRLGWVALLLGLARCAGEGQLPLGAHAEPILDGEPSDEEQNAAVLIVRGAFLGYCTAVVVAPRFVLTARHCLFDVDLGENSFVHCERPSDVAAVLAARRADSIAVYVGHEKPLPPEPAARGFAIHSSDDLDLCQNGLALLELDRPLPVAPLALRLDEPPRVGEVGTLVGWGFTTQGGPSLAEQRQQRPITIQAIGPTIYDPEGGPPRDIRESAFVGSEGACVGDDGGPLLSDSGVVIGVMSDIDNPDVVVALDAENLFNTCIEGISHFQRLDRQESWLRRVLREHGANPWLEGKLPPAAVGELCNDADECLSGLCVGAGTTQLCSVDCSAEPCPGDLQCVGPPGQRVCVPPELPGVAPDAAGCQLPARARGPGPLPLASALLLFAAARVRRTRIRAGRHTQEPA